ncbi:MAG: hypothetical protein A3I12_03310 [Gammaproteobacteria bacterium RIFCSPLOWO2_02_FULL_38_11]|nr:MAG: hypothetical protein A3B69_00975 [Gammaproteobacteria bacterium RIFCSPHIGHO2_02_FULL_38_33]OGT24182.1 MAG: hypothetical protein A2W47_01410 [Gammaproteobacteria bacterium RIFCSPHIGHO2_12_38_15]OGT69632.1 MAG: hypothetical protein A3I12_03310 [Gammaproteobacteria bacterium RIFCSPLOWO2_02_FULL_38_11]
MPTQRSYFYDTQQLLAFFNHPDFFFKYLNYAKEYCNPQTPQHAYQIAKEIENAHRTLENDILEVEHYFDKHSSSEKEEYIDDLFESLRPSEKIDMICDLSNAAFEETNKHYFYNDLRKKTLTLLPEEKKEALKQYFSNLLSTIDTSMNESKKNELLLGQIIQTKKNNFLHEAFKEGSKKALEDEDAEAGALAVPIAKLIAAILLGASPKGHLTLNVYSGGDEDVFTDAELSEDTASYFHFCILLRNRFTKTAFTIFCDLCEFTAEELDERSQKNKLTPLLVAIYAASFECTQKLISIGANFTTSVNYPAESAEPISVAAFLEKLKNYTYAVSIGVIQSQYKMRTLSCLSEEHQEKITALLEKPCYEELLNKFTSLLRLNESEENFLRHAQKYIMKLIKIEKFIKEKTLELNTPQITQSL